MFSRSHEGLGLEVFCFPVGVQEVQPHVPDADASGLDGPSMHFPKLTRTNDQSPKLNNRLRYI